MKIKCAVSISIGLAILIGVLPSTLSARHLNYTCAIDSVTTNGSSVDVGYAWYYDFGDSGTHRLIMSWGDATSETLGVIEAYSSGSGNAVHTYSQSGTYTITFSLSETSCQPVTTQISV
jgi:hypothetical protein